MHHLDEGAPEQAREGSELGPMEIDGRGTRADRAPDRPEMADGAKREAQRHRAREPARGTVHLARGDPHHGQEIDRTPAIRDGLHDAERGVADLVHANEQHRHRVRHIGEHIAHMGLDPTDLVAARIERVHHAQAVRPGHRGCAGSVHARRSRPDVPRAGVPI
jgi:hypothetical protein